MINEAQPSTTITSTIITGAMNVAATELLLQSTDIGMLFDVCQLGAVVTVEVSAIGDGAHVSI